MLGNLKPILLQNHEAYNLEYKKVYCSLCTALRTAYSLPAGMLINYDMAFILLSISKHIDSVHSTTLCPAAVFTKSKPIFIHPSIKITADITILLSWLKILDLLIDKDQKKWQLYKIPYFWLERKSKKILNKMDEGFIEIVFSYEAMIRDGQKDFSVIRKQTNKLIYRIVKLVISPLSLTEDESEFICMFCALASEGATIYDALIDLEKDQNTKTYNPILYNSSMNNTPVFEEFLKLCVDYHRIEGVLLKQAVENELIFSKSFIHHINLIASGNRMEINKISRSLI